MAPPTTPSFRIPTLERLGAPLPEDVESNAPQVAKEWFQQLTSFISDADVDGVLSLFCEDALWRDANAFTWDLRTFDGSAKIRTFLEARLKITGVQALKWKEFVRYQKPFPDTIWILGLFNFETEVGFCTAVFRLVPSSTGKWKAYTMFTNLDNLKSFPEKIGFLRRQENVPGGVWSKQRRREMEFETSPSVLIVGGGQSGLMLAARLKYLGISTLVVEQDSRIGDSWRKRYNSLCLHFPVWYDHMPYIPFPATWPKYTPGAKMAEWLESYAKLLELNVWTSSKVLGSTQEPDGKWTVNIQVSSGVKHVFRVKHFVLATGLGDAVPRVPDISNQNTFYGSVIHSSQYQTATPFKNQKVLVVGAGNSGHDIASDLAKDGIDVTLLQRSSTFVMNLDSGWKYVGGALYHEEGPPIEIADLLTHSIPHLLLEGGMAQRGAVAIMADQKELIDGLNAVGYKTNFGLKDAGILLTLKQNGGGHYFDIGATQLIIEEKIKIKSGTEIKTYNERGVEFEDGTKLDVDAVIYATGCGDMRNFTRLICGDDIAKQCPPMTGVNEEGEMSWFRALPVNGLWYMHGNLSLNRFYTKHIAMYIKAQEEGLIKTRYAADIGPDCISLRI
ncbi:hypothetical protein GALMADRAFT_228792 [Galerina marginata CBS 339.88]|uniref:FAD/NAD(P)-binding domain-containing protein n=1 Tax=Galerina marginata (strain CBS 339.88) TaxID=685588 RepID=A0A067SNK7_GALM3|nr:hypothetical protein GALMADRAFT_228792 [Galerina marginata CBS 339.88]